MNRPDRRDFLASAAAVALVPNLELLGARRGPSAPIELGLVGVGRQGRAILGELSKWPDVHVTALCDVLESRLGSGLRRAQGARGYADHRELLERETGLQALIVATPTHLHAQVALDALAAGKHVYCEAPLAASLEDCAAITAGARAAKSVFSTGMQARTNPIYALARSFARSGAIRDMISLRAQYHKKTSWTRAASDPADEEALNWHLDPKTSLGLVGEFGTHQFDVFHWFLNAYPTAVRGGGSIRLYKDGREVFDTVHCQFDFPDGLCLDYGATLANSFEGTYELFHGSMGSIKLAWNAGWMFKEADAPTQGWEVYANRERFHNEQGITLIADATKLAAQNKLQEGVGLPNPPLYYALESFLKSATEGAPVEVSADEGMRAAAVSILAARAVRSGTEVEISPELLRSE